MERIYIRVHRHHRDEQWHNNGRRYPRPWTFAEAIAWKLAETEGGALYHQLDNNCQEFIVNLVGRISLDAECPRTLRSYFRTIAKQSGFPELESGSESGSATTDSRSLSLFSAISHPRDHKQAIHPLPNLD